jgi:hypothetical protein
MSKLDQKICAWGGVFCAVTFGIGLLMAGFVPPPSPNLSAQEIADIYRGNANMIRGGMVLGLLGMAGYAAFVGVISAQMWRMKTASKLPALLQLGAGSIGVLTVMFPIMIFATTAFRVERAPELTQLLNDLGWLIIIPAFPTFIAQYGAIAAGTLLDQSERPVFPRWAAYFNIWIVLLFLPGGFAYFFRTGPFAWNGFFDFWLAAGAFFAWLVIMTPLVLKAITEDSGPK